MKTMTCKQLGGACDLEFQAETFEEMAHLSKTHGSQMKHDPAHQKAMKKMMAMMEEDPGALEVWMDEKRQEFEDLEADD